jgi:hypothetical protein
MTMYTEVMAPPMLLIDKRNPLSLIEMDHPEWLSKKGEQFATISPLKNM